MSDDVKESLLEFPCEFPIKMMGRDGDSFRQAAIELVETHAGKVPEESISTSLSRKGNFLSMCKRPLSGNVRRTRRFRARR